MNTRRPSEEMSICTASLQPLATTSFSNRSCSIVSTSAARPALADTLQTEQATAKVRHVTVLARIGGVMSFKRVELILESSAGLPGTCTRKLRTCSPTLDGLFYSALRRYVV